MQIKCITYNILKGYRAQKILENIKMFIEERGADVISLQEVEIDIDSVLPAHWRIEYFRSSRACMLAILWDTTKLNLLETKVTLFPLPKRQVFLWHFTNYYGIKLQRGALSALFSLPNGKVLRVSDIHLACEADMNHRVDSIKYLIKDLGQNFVDHEIMLGDFNTSITSPFLSNKSQEKKIERAFGKEYHNVFPEVKWTYDTSDFFPGDGFGGFIKFINFFGITLRYKLDYVFSKNLKIVSTEFMADVTGSDHRPLLATFEI